MDLTVVVITSDQNQLASLSDVLRDVQGVEIAKVDQTFYFHPPTGLDAVFLTLPAAEQWGSRPILGMAQVLRTRPEDQQSGMPPFVVTGVALRPTDPRGPLPETRMLLETALEAVRAFNSKGGEQINRLGFWAVNLLNGVTPAQLADMFSELL
jgi:hypothetical protein